MASARIWDKKWGKKPHRLQPITSIVERQANVPPALVPFLPAFWLLVPDTSGDRDHRIAWHTRLAASLDDLGGSFGAIAVIALGVLCGYPIYRSRVGLASQISRLPRA